MVYMDRGGRGGSNDGIELHCRRRFHCRDQAHGDPPRRVAKAMGLRRGHTEGVCLGHGQGATHGSMRRPENAAAGEVPASSGGRERPHFAHRPPPCQTLGHASQLSPLVSAAASDRYELVGRPPFSPHISPSRAQTPASRCPSPSPGPNPGPGPGPNPSPSLHPNPNQACPVDVDLLGDGEYPDGSKSARPVSSRLPSAGHPTPTSTPTPYPTPAHPLPLPLP